MAKEAVDHYGKGIVNVAVGTGPFRLKNWQRGGRMIFERNPNFR
jgi:ABC-type oligopeptide transport system substrate-binding subunit